MKKYILYFACVLFIASCGKDSAKNTSPVIFTESNIIAQESNIIFLSADISDKESNEINVLWRQVSGVAVELIDGQQAEAHFSAPAVNEMQTLTFEVIATDKHGATTSVSVIVTIENTNLSPNILLAQKQSLVEGEEVAIEAEVSDQDGEVVGLQWQKIKGPNVTWSNEGAKLFLLAPNLVDDEPLQFVFEIIATDNFGESSAKQVVVVVNPLTLGAGPDTDKDGFSDSWETAFQFDPLDDSSKPFDQSLNHKELLKREQSYQGTTAWHIDKFSPQLSNPVEVNLLTFTDKPWYNKGDSISIFVSGKASSASVEVFRFGYYGGELASLKYRSSLNVTTQAQCERPIENSYYNRCDWQSNHEIKIPNHWLSGLYMLKVRDDKTQTTATSLFLLQGISDSVPAIFWEDSESLFISAFVTEAGAYNLGAADPSVGASFYRAIDEQGKSVKMDVSGGIAHAVGFHRPQTYRAQRYVLFSHLPVIANLEKHNFSISYMSEWEQNKPLLRKVFNAGKRSVIDVGHSEYHTSEMRESIETLSEAKNIKWLSINAANTRFEKILKGSDCGQEYSTFADDYVFCRPNSRTRTKFAESLSNPETKYFGSRYVAGSSGKLTPVAIDPNTAIIKGDVNHFYYETNTSSADFPIQIDNYGFIETDTRLDDSKFGHVLPFEGNLKDFLLIGNGNFPDADRYSIDPSYIRLDNCSQLLHGASLGSGLALTPKESLLSFRVGNEVKGKYNGAYINLINNFLTAKGVVSDSCQ